MPLKVVLFGSLALAVFLVVAPGTPTQGNGLAAILIILFGFFFVTVSSRITGLIGNSSNPISGMTIATLILTCTIFVGVGWIGDTYAPIALGVGAVVCIAAAIGGATSQDLKTGYIVGATPILAADRSRDRGGDLGVRHRHHDPLPAPGDDDRIGFAACAAGDADVHDHPRAAESEPAVGTRPRRRLHLGHARVVRHQVALLRRRLVSPDPTTAPIFIGGVVRWWVERKTGQREESEISSARSSARDSSPAGRSRAFCMPRCMATTCCRPQMMRKRWGSSRFCTREPSESWLAASCSRRWRSSSPGWGGGR